MAGGDTTAAVAGESIDTALRAVHDVVRISGSGFSGAFKRDCTDLARRVSLLAHLLEEIRDFKTHLVLASSSSSGSCLSDLSLALQAAKRVLLSANNIDSKISSVSIYTPAIVISCVWYRNAQWVIFVLLSTFGEQNCVCLIL